MQAHREVQALPGHFMKCTQCGGKPNLIRFFPNAVVDADDPNPRRARLRAHRGPTFCPFCMNTGVEPGTIESRPGWDSD